MNGISKIFGLSLFSRPAQVTNIIGQGYIVAGREAIPVKVIISIAEDEFGNQETSGVIIIGVTPSGKKLPQPTLEPITPPVPRPFWPVPDTAVETDENKSAGGATVVYNNAPREAHLSAQVEEVLAGLPKEQREAVRKVEIDGYNSDGPGGMQGFFSPRERNRIHIDSADCQSWSLPKTIAHESFHAFTIQKLLPALAAYKEGRSDSNGYGEKIDHLLKLYLDTRSPADLPTRYAASFFYAIQHYNATGEVTRDLVVGFMEYLAELASELETKGRSGVRQDNNQLQSAYNVMEQILTAARA